MAEEEYGIKIIEAIFKFPLEIPNYQRPYKWSEKHTQQLLEDLLLHFYENKEAYRIGTIVLHKDKKQSNEDVYYIVDGQQRITTLSLILYHLHGGKSISYDFINQERAFHSESIGYLQKNSEVIKDFIEHNQGIDNFKQKFYEFITKKCSMVYVSLLTLEEAFQFFDSQNARGKALAPYDLLKAYHLRALKSESSEEINQCVENWERAIIPQDNKGSLDKIISQILFRLRQWNLGRYGEVFENRNIDIFKGVDENCCYPYLAVQKAGLASFTISKKYSDMYGNEFKIPFNIQQTIINGKIFFWFVEHYRNMEYTLFNENDGLLRNYPLQDKNIMDFIRDYNGASRTGDQYVRDLFKCTVLAYYDKFGENGLDTAIKRAFYWAYRIRLINPRVQFRTIEKEAQHKNGLLSIIFQANEPKDIIRYIPIKVEKAECSKCKELKDFFGVKDNDSK